MGEAKPERITGAEMARRMAVTDVQMAVLIADTRKPVGPNRAERRAAAKRTGRTRR